VDFLVCHLLLTILLLRVVGQAGRLEVQALLLVVVVLVV
jgi:hypothetical protein